MEFQVLIDQCKQQQAKAQRQLFDTLFPWIFGICQRYMNNATTAEDAAITSFTKIFEHINHFTYTTEAAFRTWCKTIAVNTCLMELRKTQVLYVVSELPDEETSLNYAINALEVKALFNLILQLPAGYRTVFNLYAIEGYSHSEIAKMLGISEGTSKSQLAKAKKQLQQLVTTQHVKYGTR